MECVEGCSSKLRHSSHRDIADHLEYDIDPEVWISRLLRQINTGMYEPSTPLRFSLAKSKGFSRQMTNAANSGPDLYRAIVDLLYKKARRLQKKHVYFSQATLSKVVLGAEEKARRKMAAAAMDYDSTQSAFLEWLKYDQYRKHLIFDRVFPFIVTTDINNFFDSILYSRVEGSLTGSTCHPKSLGCSSSSWSGFRFATNIRSRRASAFQSMSLIVQEISHTWYYSRTTTGWSKSLASTHMSGGWMTRTLA